MNACGIDPVGRKNVARRQSKEQEFGRQETADENGFVANLERV
jgi:hypothetical protein